MKIVFHEDYFKVYSSDPAAAPGRIEAIIRELMGLELVEPEPARESDVQLVHTSRHISYVKEMPQVYEIALLAVGGAIKASEIALGGEPAFAVIRPPGHHASRDSCWGFCYFNNIAVSIEKLRVEGRIGKAVIIDIDLHYGDGTANIFADVPEVIYHHVALGDGETFLSDLGRFLDSIRECDIVAVSAGFDRHKEDWGEMLETEDYRRAAEIIRKFSRRKCEGRRYAVLEGGYNHATLGRSVRAFIEGFR